eukprot:SAG11_NODE_368_length_10082_cov_299.189622_1_plen_295_part_10
MAQSPSQSEQSSENEVDREPQYEFSAPKFHDFGRLSTDSTRLTDSWFEHRNTNLDLVVPDAAASDMEDSFHSTGGESFHSIESDGEQQSEEDAPAPLIGQLLPQATKGADEEVVQCKDDDMRMNKQQQYAPNGAASTDAEPTDQAEPIEQSFTKARSNLSAQVDEKSTSSVTKDDADAARSALKGLLNHKAQPGQGVASPKRQPYGLRTKMLQKTSKTSGPSGPIGKKRNPATKLRNTAKKMIAAVSPAKANKKFQQHKQTRKRALTVPESPKLTKSGRSRPTDASLLPREEREM